MSALKTIKTRMIPKPSPSFFPSVSFIFFLSKPRKRIRVLRQTAAGTWLPGTIRATQPLIQSAEDGRDFSLKLGFSPAARRRGRNPLLPCGLIEHSSKTSARALDRDRLAPGSRGFGHICHLAGLLDIEHMHEPFIQLVDAQDHAPDRPMESFGGRLEGGFVDLDDIADL